MTTVLVLGAYGLIGSACAQALGEAGFEVRGLGRRDAPPGRWAAWVRADLTAMDPAGWRAALDGVDVVVNAAGALQDGPGDDLNALHTAMPTQLVAAAGTGTRLIQMSAAGVHPDASTAFFRTKARGDAAIRAHKGPWVILRPGLVIGRAAYGGTALLRAAAALPGCRLRVLPHTQIQTVALDDVAQAVVVAAQGQLPDGTEVDLVEEATHSLPEVIAQMRGWLGYAGGLRVTVPDWLLRPVGWVADLLGHLGWRSPLRSTALRVLRDGVTGDPAPWRALGHARFRAFEDTLTRMPATVQERWFARMWLLMPLCVAVLSLFWLASGLIGLWQLGPAADVLVSRGSGAAFAIGAVVTGSIIDVALGLAILWRPAARLACFGMVVVSLGYLGAATLLAPDLWLDPLGVLVKVVPAVMLALVTAALLDPR